MPSAHGGPAATLDAAILALAARGLGIVARSSWYATAPVPKSDQPDYVNGVAEVFTDLDPEALLALLHQVEDTFGRKRTIRNEARPIDLDLIDYGGLVREPSGEGLRLPHPRAHQRGFVLLPLRDIAPDWRHPVTGRHIDDLIGDLTDVNDVRRL